MPSAFVIASCRASGDGCQPLLVLQRMNRAVVQGAARPSFLFLEGGGLRLGWESKSPSPNPSRQGRGAKKPFHRGMGT
jgi:hypothetical protein